MDLYFLARQVLQINTFVVVNWMFDVASTLRIYLSLYLSVYCVLMLVSPFPPGTQLQVRSLVFLDQQVRLAGFSGGTGTEKGDRRKNGGKVE